MKKQLSKITFGSLSTLMITLPAFLSISCGNNNSEGKIPFKFSADKDDVAQNAVNIGSVKVGAFIPWENEELEPPDKPWRLVFSANNVYAECGNLSNVEARKKVTTYLQYLIKNKLIRFQSLRPQKNNKGELIGVVEIWSPELENMGIHLKMMGGFHNGVGNLDKWYYPHRVNGILGGYAERWMNIVPLRKDEY